MQKVYAKPLHYYYLVVF